MKATEINFLDFLKGTKQFIIPIFQRNYSWTPKQCQQLWNDILRIAEDDNIPVRFHFIGSIVYIGEIYQIAAVPQLLLIDGQQRLTTLSLLLHALGKAIKKSDNQTDITQKINNCFLFNSEKTDETRFKMLLSKADKETLIKLIEDKELPTPSSRRIIENYNFFEEQIRNTTSDFNMIYKGIGKLIIVDISLNRDYDNPQLIFESLNSTGLDLSQADLIRNYVLIGLDPRQQETLYNDYWLPMEQGFGQTDYVEKFDRFVRAFLTARTGRIPNIKKVYGTFKLYAQDNKSRSINDIVSELYQYSKYFIKMALEREEDKELKEIFNDINTLKVDVAYPLLLELYHDYIQNLLSKDEFVEILTLIESYVFRRAICGIPTNSLNKTFVTLSRGLDKENYLKSFKANLLLKDSNRKFPDDDEFARELVIKDIYKFRNRNFCLRKLENHERKEKVNNVEEYTIEHIMPQNENLSIEWQQELGENWKKIHTHYLHTIGNLTLTGYNPELSNRPFLEKRNMQGGFLDSPLRLNRSLASLEHWNEEEIKRRANSLAEMAIKIWKAPTLIRGSI